MDIQNPELAYASILAFESLSGRSSNTTELLGDCYLQFKDTNKAREFYNFSSLNNPKDSPLRGSLVACDLLDGNWQSVLDLLADVPTESLSIQEKTALDWARGKAEVSAS